MHPWYLRPSHHPSPPCSFLLQTARPSSTSQRHYVSRSGSRRKSSSAQSKPPTLHMRLTPCAHACVRAHAHAQGPGTRLLRVRLVELFPLWRAPLFPKCSDDLVRPPDLETAASRGHEDPPPTSLILPHPLSIHSLGDPGCVG